MLGYPYTYQDYLSEEEALLRRADFFDKGLALFAFWSVYSLISAPAFASDVPKLPNGPDAPGNVAGAPGNAPPPPVFAPVAAACSCTSPKVKTALLLLGVSTICYSAMCSNDKPLIVACSALATYVTTNLTK